MEDFIKQQFPNEYRKKHWISKQTEIEETARNVGEKILHSVVKVGDVCENIWEAA
ncbi:hypothetical protein HK096_005372, partial [Nowakowskiella sp. JEL0078]